MSPVGHRTNHRWLKFTPWVTSLSFKTRIEWSSVLTATANFPSVFFQLLQYSGQHPSFSFRYYIKQIDSMLTCVCLFSNRSQRTSAFFVLKVSKKQITCFLFNYLSTLINTGINLKVRLNEKYNWCINGFLFHYFQVNRSTIGCHTPIEWLFNTTI